MNTNATSAQDELALLRDIQLPPPPAAVSGLTGEPVVGGLQAVDLLTGILSLAVVAAILLAGWGAYRWRHRVRLAALGELSAMTADWRARGDAGLMAERLSALLRRHVARSDPSAATLSGEAWLRYLDARGGGGAFVDGCGTVLIDWPFRRPPLLVETAEVEAVLTLVKHWLQVQPPSPSRRYRSGKGGG